MFRALAFGNCLLWVCIVRCGLRVLAGMNLKFKRVIDTIYGSMSRCFFTVFIIILGCDDVT